MPIVQCRLRLVGVIPPGQWLLGVYPQHLFRIERFILPVAPDLFVARGGSLIPCDGRTHENRSFDRTLCVGGFFAFDIRNHSTEPRPIELVVSGIGIDAPEESTPAGMLGTFAMDTEGSTTIEEE